MQHIKVVVLLFLVLIPLSACSKSPEAARKELGYMNIPYTNDSFIRHVKSGDKVVVELFLTVGMSPNLREEDWPVLTIAASKGHGEIVKLLIAKGADVDAKDKDGITALMMSLVRKYPDVAKTLIKKGANVNAAITTGKGNGRTALILAAQHSTKEVVEMMLDKGANINTEYTIYDSSGSEFLYSETALTEAIIRGDLEIIKVLLSKGAKVRRTDLIISLEKEVEILKTLVSKAEEKSDLERVLSIAKAGKLFEAVDILKKAGAKE